MGVCSVCGFESRHGIICGTDRREFHCERCFMNLSLFAPCKLILGYHIVGVGRGKRFHYQKCLTTRIPTEKMSLCDPRSKEPFNERGLELIE